MSHEIKERIEASRFLTGPLHFIPSFSIGPESIEVGSNGCFEEYDPNKHDGIVIIRNDGDVFVNKVGGAEVKISLPGRSDYLTFRT